MNSSKMTRTALAVGEVIRGKARDVAYGFRMGAGFAGDVNRAHPFWIEPAQQNATNPVPAPGLACVVDPATNTVRSVLATDTAITTVYGFSVRSFPTQQTSGGPNASLGASALNAQQPLDVLRAGYMMAQVSNGTPRKGDPVFIWVAATSGSNVQGSVRTSASAGNTAAITNAYFNGPADASGVAEIVVIMK